MFQQARGISVVGKSSFLFVSNVIRETVKRFFTQKFSSSTVDNGKL